MRSGARAGPTRRPLSRRCCGCRRQNNADCSRHGRDCWFCRFNQGQSMPTKIELCNASDVEAGAVLKVEKDDLTLAVFNLDGEFFVTDHHCTHRPGSLSEGFVEGDVVECNFHGGQFNIRTGAVVGPPCMVPIKTYPTVVEGGKVFIEV